MSGRNKIFSILSSEINYLQFFGFEKHSMICETLKFQQHFIGQSKLKLTLKKELCQLFFQFSFVANQSLIKTYGTNQQQNCISNKLYLFFSGVFRSYTLFSLKNIFKIIFYYPGLMNQLPKKIPNYKKSLFLLLSFFYNPTKIIYEISNFSAPHDIL